MSILLVVKILFKEIPILYFSARISGGLDNFVSYETNRNQPDGGDTFIVFAVFLFFLFELQHFPSQKGNLGILTAF